MPSTDPTTAVDSDAVGTTPQSQQQQQPPPPPAASPVARPASFQFPGPSIPPQRNARSASLTSSAADAAIAAAAAAAAARSSLHLSPTLGASRPLSSSSLHPSAVVVRGPSPLGALSRLRSSSLTPGSAPIVHAAAAAFSAAAGGGAGPPSPSPNRGFRRPSSSLSAAADAPLVPSPSQGSLRVDTATAPRALVFTSPNGTFAGTRAVLVHDGEGVPIGRLSAATAPTAGTTAAAQGNDPPSEPPAPAGLRFASKVVSRQHAMLWCEGGKIYVQDTRSSSGTFVNGHRLAPQGQESPRVELRPGDTVQLGEDCELNG
ncbi:hypothetical protein HK405_011167, partial [Cladochytrium tenue]